MADVIFSEIIHAGRLASTVKPERHSEKGKYRLSLRRKSKRATSATNKCAFARGQPVADPDAVGLHSVWSKLRGAYFVFPSLSNCAT
jgi:hypothetical protein